jgi:hypothetical protein
METAALEFVNENMAVEHAWMCIVDLKEGQIFELFDLFIKKNIANYEKMNNRAHAVL